MKRSALVVVLSDVSRDPRVLREIRWLQGAGWSVETLGLGIAPPGVTAHWPLRPAPSWTSSRGGRALLHALLPNRAKFQLLTAGRVPPQLLRRLRGSAFELVVMNDIDFAPWVANRNLLPTPGPHVHLDIHEFFPPHLPPGSRLRIRVDSYHVWLRSFLSHPRITSRSTVAGAIADAYVAELGIARPGIVRNAPDAESLDPSPVDGDRVRLVHHGVAQWKRGIREMIAAVGAARPGIELTLMLTGAVAVIAEIRQLAAETGGRVHVVEPVAIDEVAREINRHDLEVMFYPPHTENLLFALPNKLFEAIQGRLGLVIGESPMMLEIAHEFGNAEVVAGWTPADLTRSLNALTPSRVRELKERSTIAAVTLNSQGEGRRFLQVLSDHGLAHPHREVA